MFKSTCSNSDLIGNFEMNSQRKKGQYKAEKSHNKMLPKRKQRKVGKGLVEYRFGKRLQLTRHSIVCFYQIEWNVVGKNIIDTKPNTIDNRIGLN